MPYEVTEDTGAAAASWSRDGGYVQPRVFQVRFYDELDDRARPLNAMDVPEIPNPGQRHPAPKWAYLTVVGMQVAAIDETSFAVTVNYGRPRVIDLPPNEGDPATAIVSVSTVLVEVETQFDIFGKQIKTKHDPEATPDGVPGSVRAFHASTEVRYQRREENSPGSKARTHVGTLNKTPIFGDTIARTWMCSELSGSSDDGGFSYIVNYAFLRSPHSKYTGTGDDTVRIVQPWDPTILEVDSTGAFVTVPDPIPAGYEGKKVIKVQGESTFGALNLTL